MSTVLIVDDDRDISKLIQVNLLARNYDVLTAADGKEGLDAARRGQPDLILLDLVMPVMNGLEMLEELRKDSDIPVIILSAYGKQADIERARELGIEGFLTKPFTIEGLLDHMEVVLSFSRHSYQN